MLTGIAKADLTLRLFTEHPHSNREDIYDVYESNAVQVPMCFILVAEMCEQKALGQRSRGAW